jgi:hypothetical protein
MEAAMKKLALLLFVASMANAEPWRTFAGSYSSRWKTVGLHGHDQPGCTPIIMRLEPGVLVEHVPDCDARDFARGNLDNSIGFRFGRERDLFDFGRLHVIGGAEGAVGFTEYNLTQNDFLLVSGAVMSGLELDLRHARIGGRYGLGLFATSDLRERGVLGFRELTLTVPLRPGSAVRLSRRDVDSLTRYGRLPSPGENPQSPAATETSVLLVSAPDYEGSSRWEFAAATGSTHPGAGVGSDRALRATAFTRVTALRALGSPTTQLELSWSSTAHESSRPTVFRGYDGNFRSKTINGFGVAFSQTRELSERFALRYSGGIEVADWRDEHELLTRDGRELRAGIEGALTGTVAVRIALSPHIAFEPALQKVYWRNLDLGEARAAFGLVFTY